MAVIPEMPACNLGADWTEEHAFVHQDDRAQKALTLILAAVQFERACPGTFNFERCEALCKQAMDAGLASNRTDHVKELQSWPRLATCSKANTSSNPT